MSNEQDQPTTDETAEAEGHIFMVGEADEALDETADAEGHIFLVEDAEQAVDEDVEGHRYFS